MTMMMMMIAVKKKGRKQKPVIMQIANFNTSGYAAAGGKQQIENNEQRYRNHKLLHVHSIMCRKDQNPLHQFPHRFPVASPQQVS